ncbi:MAG: hypothetical protein E5V18_04175 [Mesorhizobium sp.]|nr:MAG: hypothetical protein E5V18_04175 [Mesorhizobium sp.]
MSTTPRRSTTGLRQFLNFEQQRNWIEGKTNLRDADERSESMELRFKYVARFQKLLCRPQAQEVLKILRLYGENCIPIPDHSPARGQLDEPFLEHCVTTPDDVGCFFPRGEDIFGINVRGSASIHKFLAARQVLRAIRRFNLTHMNRGRNAYQASHCYSLADYLLEG